MLRYLAVDFNDSNISWAIITHDNADIIEGPSGVLYADADAPDIIDTDTISRAIAPHGYTLGAVFSISDGLTCYTVIPTYTFTP